ncbi:MAG: helix-turn-helix domain-containing protein [Eubacteriales bacterium]|jgi:AraC-like DNA-binding protein
MPYREISRKLDFSYRRSCYLTPSIAARECMPYVLAAGHYRANPAYEIAREGVEGTLLLFTLSGEGRLTYGGRSYALRAGQMFFIDCAKLHVYTTQQAPWEFLWVQCGGVEGYYRYLTRFTGSVFAIENQGAVRACMMELLEKAEVQGPLYEVESSEMLVRLCCMLLRDWQGEKEGQESVAHQPVLGTMRLLEECCEKKWSVQELAQMAGYSKFHFIRTFKKVCGHTPGEYLLRCRVARSKELLRDTGASVEEVAEQVGFHSASQFIRVFRTYEGVTPHQYRKYWESM